jgi:hypothetical protein
MDLNEHLKTRLRQRVEHQITLEMLKDVDALYRMIDPAIRRERAQEYDVEPELTISEIRAFVNQVQSAHVAGVDIDSFTPDGGAVREHRPTAIVTTKVVYNDRPAATVFRTPWVLDHDEWYTRALGKFGSLNARPNDQSQSPPAADQPAADG